MSSFRMTGSRVEGVVLAAQGLVTTDRLPAAIGAPTNAVSVLRRRVTHRSREAREAVARLGQDQGNTRSITNGNKMSARGGRTATRPRQPRGPRELGVQ